MQFSHMRLRVLLPFEVFADETDVSRIVVESSAGSLGLLPHRLDCVAALAPGILVYETAADGEVCLAVDEGVLVKTGSDVQVSVRRAFWGADRSHGLAHNLGELREAVKQAFLTEDAEARTLRVAMATVESGFLRRLARYERA